MGFTVDDMLILTGERYKMTRHAGQNGGANSISWLLMVEDTTITGNFMGKELAVTTGLGFGDEEKLLNLVRILDAKHAAGLIVNVGFYIHDIPASVIELADKCDLPLISVPWDISMSEMIKDLTVRIFLQTQTDEQISSAFIKAIESPHLEGEYREELSASFDVDGKFQVVLFSTEDLDSMDTMDRKRIGYRLQIYLEKISHNAHFFYYDGCFILIFNAVEEVDKADIINGFIERAKIRMPDKHIYLGEGSAVKDVNQIHTSYERAKYALNCAKQKNQTIVDFDDLGVYRLLYSIADETIVDEMVADLLRPILDYDSRHNSNLEETLLNYLRFNGSIQRVSAEMFIHKNTILYRITKIKELLNSELEDEEERMLLYLVCKLRNGKQED